MLTGVVLGIIIMLLVFAVFYLKGQNVAYAGQVTKLAKEQADVERQLAYLAAREQERSHQAINVGFTDEQITTISNRLASRMQVIMDAVNAAALKKMD